MAGKRGTRKSGKVRLHIIGHGHIDPVWLWRWTEGLEEVRATFQSALDRMKETEDFTFTSSSAAFYKWVRDLDPRMFSEIRRRVKEGRWDVAGGWWIEPDCNIPHGESLARHGLYSQRFFKKELGVRARVGFNPDSFGHAGTFPQIFKKMGIDFYAYSRPSAEHEFRYPDGNGTTFWWESPDGSRILACVLPHGYGCGDDVRRKIDAVPHWPHLLPGQKEIFCFYGVGNHGGGPTIAAIKAILAAKKDPNAPEVVFSTLENYFRDFLKNPPDQEIPVVNTELQHHARGCYSVHSEIKYLNRKCEHALMAAERFAAVGALGLGVEYPALKIQDAWENVLFHQFHDILAGTSIEPAYVDARDALGAARFTADNILHAGLTRIAKKVDTTAEGRSVLLFNPLPWPVREPVEITRHLERGIGESTLLDENDNPVPSQKVFGDQVESQKIITVAELPPCGYRAFRAVRRDSAPKPVIEEDLEVSRTHIENDFWRLELDPFSGEISRLFDKKRELEVLQRGAILAAMVDHSDTWSHDIRGYRVEDARFSEPAIEVFDCGDILATIRVRTGYSRSTADQYITLYRDIPLIDGAIKINWQESYRALKLGFETRVRDGLVFAEAPYGVTERNRRGEEEPCQSWIAMEGKALDSSGNLIDYGVALINDGKYGYDARGGVLRLTLLRSPAYAHHDDARFDASKPNPIIDTGLQTVKWRLVPYAGRWQEALVPKLAWQLNEPPVSHQEYSHRGEWPLTRSFLGADQDNILLSVLKIAEDGDDIIIRGYETWGRETSAVISLGLMDLAVKTRFGPHEIKTLRISRKTGRAREVNLLEE